MTQILSGKELSKDTLEKVKVEVEKLHEQKVIESINPEKDVNGFYAYNIDKTG